MTSMFNKPLNIFLYMCLSADFYLCLFTLLMLAISIVKIITGDRYGWPKKMSKESKPKILQQTLFLLQSWPL